MTTVIAVLRPLNAVSKLMMFSITSSGISSSENSSLSHSIAGAMRCEIASMISLKARRILSNSRMSGAKICFVSSQFLFIQTMAATRPAIARAMAVMIMPIGFVRKRPFRRTPSIRSGPLSAITATARDPSVPITIPTVSTMSCPVSPSESQSLIIHSTAGARIFANISPTRASAAPNFP